MAYLQVWIKDAELEKLLYLIDENRGSFEGLDYEYEEDDDD